MFATATKQRPIVKTHGGKAYLARRIIAHLPPHYTYVEPYAGGLSVLLNKPSAAVEVASDLNGDLIGLYRTLQAHPVKLARRLARVEYDQATFDAAASAPTDNIDAAVRFMIRNRMSRGGLGTCFAWSDRLRGGQPGDVNAWQTILAMLPSVADRLRDVDIRHAQAVEVIREHDAPDTLHYCDPPYLHQTRTVRDAYTYEMTRDEHAELLDVLAGCRGAVVLSGYPSSLYDARLGDWQRVTYDMPNHSGQGHCKERRTEVLWMGSHNHWNRNVR